MTKAVTLKACPFDAGAAKLTEEEDDEVGGHFVACTTCSGAAWGETPEAAAAAWNNRPYLTPATGAAEQSVDDIPDAKLLERAVYGARGRTGRINPRWHGIADTFALGSTYSRQLCRRYGLDPDEKVRR